MTFKRLGVVLSLVTLILACPASEARVDWSDPEAEQWLTTYLRIDTTNPPGNETAGAEFLKSVLDREGIESRLIGRDPGRQSLYARIRSGSSRPVLLLLHHIDVVPANAAEWHVPPFSGDRSGGYFWGRGALDAKSLGIAHLAAFIDLQRRGAKLTRDVVFLASADEERGGTLGVAALLESHPELFQNIGTVLNEGGMNQTVVDRIISWGVEVDQKLPLWLRITTTGRGGHGATARHGQGAAERLISVLSELPPVGDEFRLTPTVARHFRFAARTRPPEARAVLIDPESYFSSEQLESGVGEGRMSLLHDTISIGRLQAGTSVNSVPSEAFAEVDIRLLPDGSPTEVLQRIERAVGDRAAIEVLLRSEPAPPSPIDSSVFRYFESKLPRVAPGSIVIPTVSSGATDSRFFRSRGVDAYGFNPFSINYYDGATIHAANEKIRIRFFVEGVRLMRTVVHDLATAAE